jgi:hypothetical protein
VPSPVFRRLGRVDQDGIVELSGELRSVFNGGAHVVLGVLLAEDGIDGIDGVVHFELGVRQNYEK